jgi:hypothetical protein
MLLASRLPDNENEGPVIIRITAKAIDHHKTLADFNVGRRPTHRLLNHFRSQVLAVGIRTLLTACFLFSDVFD